MILRLNHVMLVVSTHSRPKAAVDKATVIGSAAMVSTHSRPKAADKVAITFGAHSMFQHTAARRRLVLNGVGRDMTYCFNTQPPEGGWKFGRYRSQTQTSFNTQPPEGG